MNTLDSDFFPGGSPGASGGALPVANIVFGPAACTDNAMVRWDGTNGKLVQDSPVVVADSPLTGAAGISVFDSHAFAVNQSGTAGYQGLRVVATETATGSGQKDLLSLETAAAVRLRVDNVGNLVQSSAATSGQRLYNTADETTNYERATLAWVANVFTIDVQLGGAGTQRTLQLKAGTTTMTLATSGSITLAGTGTGSNANATAFAPAANTTIRLRSAITNSQTVPGVSLCGTATSYNSAAGVQVCAVVDPDIAQSSTAGYKALRVNPTETSTGSGQKDLISAEVSGAVKWRCDNVGSTSACVGTAIPAGGTAGVGLKVSSTSNFGVFFGSGAPSLTAAKGSLYLRSDGSGTGDRMYVNTDGGTTWTAVTTAA